ncbi:endonuclease VII domain-containing protein [Nonomuraea sp. NPDC059023]|uniref:endonuclease VII domain-containing protein n=1 Tax=unclassified Nonomuraea TaxID=2593643 RepID=UPI0036AFB91C
MSKHVRARNYDSDRARDLNRRYHYGITTEEFDEIFTAQSGKCAICGTTEWPGKHNRPHVDHCHKTGNVRGILCTNCNQGLGRFRDRVEILEAAIAYLTNAAR